MSFKIIAVRPLANCAKNVLKNLTPDEFYFLDNSFQPNNNKTAIEKRKEVKALSTDFFSLNATENSSSLKNINIQAIVGKNGSGKSSLIELLLRMLNNFFKNQEVNNLTKKLRYVKGVSAELYFSINEKGEEIVYKMTVDTLGLEIVGNTAKRSICNVEPKVTDICKQLFFTMYVNYSLYGLDAKDYLQETIHEKPSVDNDHSDDEELKPWLGRVFHKNDGYQTQLVIHPWREAGRINIRNEKELMRQRLITQIILEDSFNQLTDNQFVKSFKFQLSDEQYLFNYITNLANLEPQSKSRTTDLAVYGALRGFFNKDIGRKGQEVFYDLISVYLEDIVSENKKALPKLINRKILKKGQGDYNLNFLFDVQLKEVAILSLCFQSIESEVVKYEEIKDSQFLKSLFFYSVRKLRKTLRYPRLSHLNYDYRDLNPAEESSLLDKLVRDISSEVIKDDSHISIKLRQAITILRLVKENTENPLVGIYKDLAENPNEFNIVKLKDNIKIIVDITGIEPINFVPPPVFDIDILLEGKDKKLSSWKEISSGEFQKTGIISSLIYHLSNLDSVKGGKNSKGKFYNYKNINVILDEIELYFHPEYQRTFIHDLISRLQKIRFKSIKSVNIIFITHSPFILSDILSRNTLKLENGKPKGSDNTNSFASNIHDLLKDEFFLKGGSMGEFAKTYINLLINEVSSLLHKNDELLTFKLDKDAYKSFEDRIMIIGEPLIRNSLLKMLEELKDDIATEQKNPSYETLLAFYREHNN